MKVEERAGGGVAVSLTDEEAANLEFEIVQAMGMSDDLTPLARLFAQKIRSLMPQRCQQVRAERE